MYTRGLKHLPRDYGCLLQGAFVLWQISPLVRIATSFPVYHWQDFLMEVGVHLAVSSVFVRRVACCG
jgi:hypothetical protein